MAGCSEKHSSSGEYPIRPVPFTSVKLTDNFWAPRIKKNADVTIPIAFHYCETTGRIKNFEIAGGLDTGKFQTIYPFDDSDVYKIIEGASYSLQTYPDPKLDAYLDSAYLQDRTGTGNRRLSLYKPYNSREAWTEKDCMNGQIRKDG